MSTQKTANYQLNQWVKSDRILMEEFNADNLKIDDAIAAVIPTTNPTSTAIFKTLALRICGGGFWWVQAAATP